MPSSTQPSSSSSNISQSGQPTSEPQVLEVAPEVDLHLATLQRTVVQLLNAAYTDKLTGLLNRTAFDKLRDAQDRSSKFFGVVFIDLIDFKSLNQRLGMQGGDAGLVTVASALRTIDPTAKIVRYGGDEFVTLLETAESTRKFAAAASKALGRGVDGALAQDPAGKPVSFKVRGAVGYTTRGNADTPLHELVKQASVASKQAKHSGGKKAVGWESGLQEAQSIEERWTCKQCQSLIALVIPEAKKSAKLKCAVCGTARG